MDVSPWYAFRWTGMTNAPAASETCSSRMCTFRITRTGTRSASRTRFRSFVDPGERVPKPFLVRCRALGCGLFIGCLFLLGRSYLLAFVWFMPCHLLTRYRRISSSIVAMDYAEPLRAPTTRDSSCSNPPSTILRETTGNYTSSV